MGSKSEMIKLTPPKTDDVAVIMYTSGSTGVTEKPKEIIFNKFFF